MSGVTDCKNFWMSRHRKVGSHNNLALSVSRSLQPLSDRGCNDPCRPEHGACHDSLPIHDDSFRTDVRYTSVGVHTDT